MKPDVSVGVTADVQDGCRHLWSHRGWGKWGFEGGAWGLGKEVRGGGGGGGEGEWMG